MDQSKKTMRHFYCRDVLWETFEQMANDFDCSIDYLINEAMRYYARSKNYQSAAGSEFRSGLSGADVKPGGMSPTGSFASGASALTGGPTSAHVAGAPSGAAPRRAAAPPPPPPPRAAAAAAPAYLPSTAPPPEGRSRVPGTIPRPVSDLPAATGAAPTLFLLFNNQRFAIDKEQFIIGRGSKTSDLAIKDGNISRKHAAVIRRNGTYYIKDLGSTNGIDFKGMRIDNKRIDEGDVFHLCDYELRFTYR